MRSYAAFCIGVVAIVSLIGATLADMASSQQTGASSQQTVDLLPVPPAAVVPQATVVPPVAGEAGTRPEAIGQGVDPLPEANPARDFARRARGLYVRPNGNVTGRVNYINPNSLRLIPVPNALVTFVQQRHVVAQGITGQDGMFDVPGLSPWGVYSLFISSQDWVMMVSMVARPFDHDDDHWSRDLRPVAGVPAGAPDTVGRASAINEIRLVSTNMSLLQAGAATDDDQNAEADADANAEENAAENENMEGDDLDRDDYVDYEFLELQVLPREDFIAALRQGLLGLGFFGPDGAPSGGPGGSGGSGGGGDISGLGIGLIGAGLGAAAGIAGDHDGELASPFTP